MSRMWSVYFDGASRGNPGYSSYGYVLKDEDGIVFEQDGGVIGNCCTNNEAEYAGMIEGMLAARRNGVDRLRVVGDSQLVVQQMLRRIRVRSQNLIGSFETAQRIASRFHEIHFEAVPREENYEADHLANVVLNKHYRSLSK